MTQPRTDIYVGIGSNLGNRQENLSHAVSAIRLAGFPLLASSSIYETEPVGYRDQPWFLNQVVRVGMPNEQTTGHDDAEHFLGHLLAIEQMLGRQRHFPECPRVIDLDLLLWGSEIIGIPNALPPAGRQAIDDRVMAKDDRSLHLVVPHPRLHLRRFVLVPLSELSPDLVHPVLGKSIKALLEQVADPSIVRLHNR